jgi:hypothetical protein
VDRLDLIVGDVQRDDRDRSTVAVLEHAARSIPGTEHLGLTASIRSSWIDPREKRPAAIACRA